MLEIIRYEQIVNNTTITDKSNRTNRTTNRDIITEITRLIFIHVVTDLIFNEFIDVSVNQLYLIFFFWD